MGTQGSALRPPPGHFIETHTSNTKRHPKFKKSPTTETPGQQNSDARWCASTRKHLWPRINEEHETHQSHHHHHHHHDRSARHHGGLLRPRLRGHAGGLLWAFTGPGSTNVSRGTPGPPGLQHLHGGPWMARPALREALLLCRASGHRKRARSLRSGPTGVQLLVIGALGLHSTGSTHLYGL